MKSLMKIANGKSFSKGFLQGKQMLMSIKWTAHACVRVLSIWSYSPLSDTTVSQDEQELREMYDSMIPEFAEAYPHVFSLDKFSFESFVWADNILNNYSIDNPLAIVPL